jgi:hypothetical protein
VCLVVSTQHPCAAATPKMLFVSYRTSLHTIASPEHSWTFKLSRYASVVSLGTIDGWASCLLLCIVTIFLDMDFRGAFGSMAAVCLVEVLWLALNSLAGGRELGAVICTADVFATFPLQGVSVQLLACLYSCRCVLACLLHYPVFSMVPTLSLHCHVLHFVFR